MKRLLRFLLLTPTDRRLLVSSALLLGATRLGLRLLPFQTLRHLLARMAEPPGGRHRADRSSPDRIAWAVTAASWSMPGVSTCLVQALVLQVLLEREGFPASLRIGVARGQGGQLEGHAWVESQGRIVIGGSERGCYTALAAFKGELV